MAVSLVALKFFGTGFPAGYRVVNSAATQLGDEFATVILTGAPSGAGFTAGEALSFGGGGTAVYVETFTGPDRIVIAQPSGTLSGLITGGSSGETATVSSVEGLETAPSSNQQESRAILFQGVPYCWIYNTIYWLDESLGTTGQWREAYRITNTFTTAANTRNKIGLFVVHKNGVQSIATYWTANGSTSVYRVISPDGITWSELLVSAGSGIVNTGLQRAAVVNNVLYAYVVNSAGIMSWDPDTDSFITTTFAFLGSYSSFISARNRLFVHHRANSGNGALYELIGGVWSQIIDSGIGSGVSGKATLFIGSDGEVYSFFPGSASGSVLIKWDVDALTFSDVSNPVLPAALRSGAGAGAAGGWDVYPATEDEAAAGDNASPTIYLWFSAASTAGTPRTTYQFVDDATEMTLLDSGGATREIALHYHEGGGARTFFTGELDVSLDARPLPIAGGERWSFRVWKKPGAASVPSVGFRALYRAISDSTQGAIATRRGYISAVSAGSVDVGNRGVSGLTADSERGTPGTLYTVDVLLVSQDGIANFSRISRVGLAYV